MINPTLTYEREFGVDWDPKVPVHQRHLTLWQRHKESPYCYANLLNPVSEHFLTACRMLFSKDQLTIHPWFEEMAEAYTRYAKVILMGAAGSGKSHFLGLALLLDYLTDPARMYCNMVSTTKEDLKRRSLASSIEYLGYLRQHPKFYCPFKYVDQKSAIVPENTDDFSIDSVKSRIQGVAIREGSSQDAKSALIGVHLPRIRSVADEFENMGDKAGVFLKAQSNLAACEDYKQVLAFNPQSIYSPGCLLATPKDGWVSVNLDSCAWEAPTGYKVLRFDGHKSPGVADPKRYPFLPTTKSLSTILDANHGNDDAPEYWTMARSFPPPQGEGRTVLTEAMVKSYNMMGDVTFRAPPLKMAALDPAFTSDGDDCVLVVGRYGETVDRVFTLCFEAPRYLTISASDPRPVTEQIVDQVRVILAEEEIPLDRLGVDDSGTQSVADAIVMKLGAGVHRYNFSARPPELPVSVANAALASTKYKNTVTWLWHCVKEYGSFGQIRGLPVKAAEEFCQRRLTEKQQPYSLETKRDAKKRLKRSPDTGDACSILAGMFRQVVGVMPGQTVFDPAGFIPAFSGGVDQEAFIRRMNNLSAGYGVFP